MGGLDEPEQASRREAIGRDIKAKFALFDKDARGHCEVKEVGTLVRALGASPSEQQLRGLIAEMEDEEPSGLVRFEKFERLMSRVLMENQFPRDSDEKLLSAFRVIDADGKGAIAAGRLRELLTTKGEPFSAEEVEDMLSFAANAETGLVQYDDYVTLLELQ